MARARRKTWAKRVKQWKRSGLTGGEFAARLGVKEATLRHWKWVLDREQLPPRAPAFVQVVPAEVAAPSPSVLASALVEPQSLELVVADARVRVVVPMGFDEDTLRRVLRVLEGD